MSSSPPFKLAGHAASFGSIVSPMSCGHEHGVGAAPDVLPEPAPSRRLKLAELPTHFQCSVIGTCLGTAALRKLMSKFILVDGIGDLDIHHESVLLAAEPGPASKAIHKALDQAHDAALAKAARLNDPAALARHWEEALATGDVPGAYWAMLTHRATDIELRNRVFGDVHMLSHRVGAANRADIRRLVALEQANASLTERLERQHERHLSAQSEHAAALHRLEAERDAARLALIAGQARHGAPAEPDAQPAATATHRQLAFHTLRREQAEQASAAHEAAAALLREEAAYLRRHAGALAEELAAAEAQLRELAQGDAAAAAGAPPLRGRRILYVGGRPSSTPSIRDLVLRQGGEFRHHDGGLEDRKGLLESGVAWADVVVFPVDCVDHDSAGSVKRQCHRQGIRFLPLRSSGIGCFAGAIAQMQLVAVGGDPQSWDDDLKD